MLQGRSNTDSSLIIKFDGQYWYWGVHPVYGLVDPNLKHIDGFKPITELEVKKFIKAGITPKSEYLRVNPKIDGMRI